MAYIAPIDKMASNVTTQAPPAIIVVTQTIKCPMSTPSILGGTGGSRAYPFVA